MSDPTGDLHDNMSPEDFIQKVQTFQFWFESVEGYLHGLEFGLTATADEPTLSESATDHLVTVLCNYCIGETAALEGSGALIQIAPNSASQVFLSTQAVDEGRHLEVLSHRLGELLDTNVADEIERRANRNLLEFKAKLLETIRNGDWMAAIFAQNVILESMEFAVFNAHVEQADERTAQVLRGIIKDERRHIGFGQSQLGRVLVHDPAARKRLKAVRESLDPLVIGVFEETMEDLSMPRDDRAQLVRGYLQAVQRLGLA